MESLTLQLLPVCVCVCVASKSYWHLRGKGLETENEKEDEVQDRRGLEGMEREKKWDWWKLDGAGFINIHLGRGERERGVWRAARGPLMLLLALTQFGTPSEKDSEKCAEQPWNTRRTAQSERDRGRLSHLVCVCFKKKKTTTFL